MDDMIFAFLDCYESMHAIQRIQWKIIPDNTRVILELISPLKSKVHRVHKHKSLYCMWVCIVHSNCENPRLEPGETIIFEMPLQTFTRAMWTVPKREKESLGPDVLKDDNMLIEFTRDNHKQMTIHSIERRQVQEKQKEYTDKYYSDEYN